MAKITKLDDIVSLCKRRGFIFQSSEIYGGLAIAVSLCTRWSGRPPATPTNSQI
jgi:hypothetical protein